MDTKTLRKQTRIALKLTLDLANRHRRIRYHQPLLPLTYKDVKTVAKQVESFVENDIDIVPADSQPELLEAKATIDEVVDKGPFLYLLSLADFAIATTTIVNEVLTAGECTAFVIE